MTAIAIFTLASLGCALSQTLGELVALRAIQGAGGALMVPVGRYAVLRDAKKSEVVRLVAYVVWPGLVAPVIAPLVGGVITTYAELAVDLRDQHPARDRRVLLCARADAARARRSSASDSTCSAPSSPAARSAA